MLTSTSILQRRNHRICWKYGRWMWQKKVHGSFHHKTMRKSRAHSQIVNPNKDQFFPWRIIGIKKCNQLQQGKTMQDNCDDLLGQWNHHKKWTWKQKIELCYFAKRFWKKNPVCRCNLVITSYSPWMELFNDVTSRLKLRFTLFSPQDFSK